MTKTFIVLQFGSPHPWTQQYIDGVQKLAPYGWKWKLFTPNNFQSKGNFEVVPMTIDQFADLVGHQVGVRPNLHLTEAGIPNFHVTEFAVFFGAIFQDYLRGRDFWGITGLDNVYGRLDHFFPDSLLADCAIYSDNPGNLDGNFSLWRNSEGVKMLYQRLNWKAILSQGDCPGCTGTGEHSLYSPEDFATKVLTPGVRFKTPKYHFAHSHDRLEQHQPVPKLKVESDGSLWEFFSDKFGIANAAREIPLFHFSYTKRWPL
jgi:hypothetical protein